VAAARTDSGIRRLHDDAADVTAAWTGRSGIRRLHDDAADVTATRTRSGIRRLHDHSADASTARTDRSRVWRLHDNSADVTATRTGSGIRWLHDHPADVTAAWPRSTRFASRLTDAHVGAAGGQRRYRARSNRQENVRRLSLCHSVLLVKQATRAD
jgi:hypothetical protein